jgi:hypothetical protein
MGDNYSYEPKFGWSALLVAVFLLFLVFSPIIGRLLSN